MVLNIYNVYKTIYVQNIYFIYIILYTSFTKKYFLCSIQITFGTFFEKLFVDREIQIEEIEITELNIIWLYCHYADYSRAHNNALFVLYCNWYLGIPSLRAH